MRMKILAAMATSVLILVAAPQSAFAAKPSFGCSQGFDVGGVTLTQFLDLPRHRAGLEAGAFDEEFLLSVFSQVDHNGDRVVCLKDVAALNGGVSFWPYVYNVVDNNASVSSG